MKPASPSHIRTIYQQSLILGQAFAVFRLPGAKNAEYITGMATHSLKSGREAFVFAPFDPAQKPWYIQTHSPSPSASDSVFLKGENHKSTSKKEFLANVKKIMAAIGMRDFKKIVAARIVALKKPQKFEAVAFFEKLCSAYPNTFVSLSYIPDVGIWIGASPEILVSETSAQFTTYSLAGTKEASDSSVWTEKEKEEQAIVTDFISQKLSGITDADIRIKGPTAHRTGKLKHLLTVFTIAGEGRSLWRRAVRALHPTPAVAGLPQRKAIDFIKCEESFDRGFYAGYLGPVNREGRTDLFVNLRCMEVTDTQIILYAGCGVTAGSDPEQEWTESEKKIDVLKSLL